MNRKILLAMVGAIASIGSAVAAPPTFTLSADKKIVTANVAPGVFTPPASKAGLTSIFNNFATRDPKGVYMAGEGLTIGGPTSIVGQIWIAAAFTPATNATVAEVDVAAGYVLGAKAAVDINIYADAGGLPGQALWTHRANLPDNGPCCALVAVRDKDGLQLAAGTQYWIGLTTLPNGTDTFGAWDFNVADQVDTGTVAENQGSGWVAQTSLPNVAFGVYSK